MAKALRTLVLASLLCPITSAPSWADGLIQINPVTVAPPLVNNVGPAPNTGIYMDHTEYPMFSKDGRLFFWTSQENPDPGTQWIWVSYFKNRDAFNQTNPGDQLPPLILSTPVELHLVNHQFATDTTTTPHTFPMLAGVPPYAEIKALAVCEEHDELDEAIYDEVVYDHDWNDTIWRYRVTLYLAVGVPTDIKKMWRQHRLIIEVDKATEEIIKVTTAASTFEPTQVIAPATNADGEVANETEPFFTRDGHYLFWGSDKWAGMGRMAEYMYSGGLHGRCDQLNQAPLPYSNLPQSRFAWKDQYSDSSKPTRQLTSRTNYHTMLEEESTGRTALIFEECQGQLQCHDDPNNPTVSNNRDCYCDQTNDQLMTTGFDAGGSPTPIANLVHPNVTANKLIWNAPKRATHPAISGPQNPDGSWLLFFMRGKRIWYTKIAKDPANP